ncbi:MAG TPA: hypothetical protein VJL59_07750, partial [Anaerolineales bacterium]|nr:hypothetical protein [Anaerolineales bacterium]
MSQTRRIILAFIVTQLMVVAVAVYLGFAVQEYHRQRQGTQTALQLTASASPPLSPTYTFPSTAQHQTWAAQAQTAYPISPTQYAIWTETAQPPTIDPNAPTPIPLPVWLAPSGEWTRYTHPIYGYSFEYPSNWPVSEEYIDDGVSVVNYDTSLPGPAPKDGNGVNRLRLSFGPTVSLGNQSLENF